MIVDPHATTELVKVLDAYLDARRACDDRKCPMDLMYVRAQHKDRMRELLIHKFDELLRTGVIT